MRYRDRLPNDTCQALIEDSFDATVLLLWNVDPVTKMNFDGYETTRNVINVRWKTKLKGHFTHMKLFFKITEIETLINITYIVRFLRSTDVSAFYY